MILGADISTLDETKRLGGRFYDSDGKEGELVPILVENGFNAVRLRLWNDPYSLEGEPYGAGGCDLPCLMRTARSAVDAGMDFLLDFHYSDFWCDPSRQLLPKAWQNMSFTQLTQAVYDYTRDILVTLSDAGLSPRWVQPGNEITGGMLWPLGKLDGSQEGFDRLCALLNSACRAIREYSDAKIILHLERSGDNACYREWFDQMVAHDVPFDIIGVSYYPFWHGDFNALSANLSDMIARYGREVMVIETSYAFTGEHYDASSDNVNLVINGSLTMADGSAPPYPLDREGQVDFVRKLLGTIAALPEGKGTGFWYWEPAWIPVSGSTWATEAAREYIGEQEKLGGNEWANQCLFDYQGRATPALKEFKKFSEV